MPGNTFGTLFRVTTFGESHGKALGGVIDGCPPNLDLCEADIQGELDRRKPAGHGASTARREEDRVEILSGIFEGKTTGTPIALVIHNRDVESRDYEEVREVFRPGHADFTILKKYGIRDHRGGGRSSGRETAARVAAGAVARRILSREGVEVFGFTVELGGIPVETFSSEAMAANWLLCPDPEAAERMERRLEKARNEGDTLGGIVEVRATGCPAGLGEPVFDKINADLAKAIMSVGTVKGVEIGAGFPVARMKGSQSNDAIGPGGFKTNHAGGILGGITTGQDIVVRVACKPIPSIAMEQETIDVRGNPVRFKVRGRHDACVIPRIIPVCEAMVCLVLADHLLRQRTIG